MDRFRVASFSYDVHAAARGAASAGASGGMQMNLIDAHGGSRICTGGAGGGGGASRRVDAI